MLEKWSGPALALESAPERVGFPVHILSGEAVDAARFLETHWRARRDADGRVLRPGLEQASGRGRFHANVGNEILELQEAMQAAQTQYPLTVSPPSESPAERAEFVLDELRATLEFLLDDGVTDADDSRLERLAAEHSQPASQDAFAAALDDYAGFAETVRKRIHGLGGFDAGLIDEARALAASLREQSARRVTPAPPEAQPQALDLRNRLMAMLYERLQLVRAAARFVFRHDPNTVRKATSAYQRDCVARARRAKSAVVDDSPTEPEVKAIAS